MATTEAFRGRSSNNAEKGARAAGCDHFAVAAYLGLPGHHHDELTTQLALTDQFATGSNVDRRYQPVDRRQLLRRKTLEQRDLGQTILVRSISHGDPPMVIQVDGRTEKIGQVPGTPLSV